MTAAARRFRRVRATALGVLFVVAGMRLAVGLRDALEALAPAFLGWFGWRMQPAHGAA